MSPTSYQAAPPRFMTIADAGGCVKLPHLRGNGAADSLVPKGDFGCRPRGVPVVAGNVDGNHPYNADAWLLWPSIDKSGRGAELHKRAGNELTEATESFSSRSPAPRDSTTTFAPRLAHV